jgi:hypothetical protein
MSMLLAVFHLAPWWMWLAGVAAIALVTALGLWPVVLLFGRNVVWPFLRAVPWPVWAILAAAVAGAVWLDYHDQLLTKRVTDERDTFWKARERAALEEFEAKILALNKRLDVANTNAAAAAAKAAADIARTKRERDQANAELEKQRSRNVTAEANRMCTLTRGVIVQFNADARSANGQREPFARDPAAGAGPELVDAPAGVSLDIYSGAVAETQRALGACRDQVTGWQQYHRDVLTPWIASTLEALSSFPTTKGTP